uniref:Uncharacterized protein n=1 Tax=Streptomyces sp. FR1 TaxID=349971 RepID=V9Z711_9ACTN|nr:hypothetical protein [Streptomyces sp. FR1]AHE39176.1 hypothetical protein pFRL3_399 [Streptomyces sp. FR1]
MHDDRSTVAVDVRALEVDGYPGLAQVPRDHLLRLEEDTLGMKAGMLRTDWTYSKGTYPCSLRDLEPLEADAADALIAAGVPVHEARRAPAWRGAFPVLVQGLRLSELRAALAGIDLPDDAIVAIRAADYPSQGIGSPADVRVEAGYYQPDPASGTSGWAFGGAIDYAEDGAIPAHVPALVLKPTH